MSEHIFIVAEVSDGLVDPATLGVLSVAQTLKHDQIKVVVMGSGLHDIGLQLKYACISEIIALDDPSLGVYSADAYLGAMQTLLTAEPPRLVLWPHTYQTQDYASALAYRFGKDFLGDCEQVRDSADGWEIERQVFQGKAAARYGLRSDGTSFVSLQAGGAYDIGLAKSDDSPPVRTVKPNLDQSSIRTRHLEYVEVGEQAVELKSAEIIVAVGRGIKDASNLPMIKRLAECLGAEIAASRPVCDEGWLPHSSQVGSSGQIVRPKIYIALGISGAAQHLAGMRGASTIIAINKDPSAPIFKIADVAVTADLFEVVPLLIDALEAPEPVSLSG